MAGRDLRASVTAFVKQLQAKVQRLTGDVTTLDVSTYTVPVGQFATTVEGIDAGTVDALATRLASADPLSVQRCGFTQITFDCDVMSCTETGRTDEVDPAVDAMHGAVVDQALVGREAILSVTREVVERVR
jgi:hypothetical protein